MNDEELRGIRRAAEEQSVAAEREAEDQALRAANRTRIAFIVFVVVLVGVILIAVGLSARPM